MICPRCGKDNTTLVGNTHYVCNIETCVDEKGARTQFQFVEDEKIMFPHNVIYPDKGKQNFFRKPYLSLVDLSSKGEGAQ
jgi:hypothetical protein